MTDITQYSDRELSLLCNNDEGLYKEYMHCVRRNRFDMLRDILHSLYKYTDAQLEDLREDFDLAVEEYSKEHN